MAGYSATYPAVYDAPAAGGAREASGFTVYAAGEDFSGPAQSWGNAAGSLPGWDAKSYSFGAGSFTGWANVQLTGSALQIRCVYSAGAWSTASLEHLGASFEPPYWIEARAKCSARTGFLSAPCWSSSAPYGSDISCEVDACETIGGSPALAQQTVQGATSGLTRTTTVGSVADWHTYAAKVTATEVTFYVDDIETNVTTTAEMVAHGGVNRADAVDLRLMMRCGGAWEGTPSTSDSPQVMEVDYIRAWTRAAGGEGGGSSMALGTPYTVVSGYEVITSGTTWQVPITHDVAVGDAIVVSAFDNNTVISGVTDSAGNDYQLKVSETSLSIKTFQFVALNCGAMTVTGGGWLKLTFVNPSPTSTQIAFTARACSGVLSAAAADPAATLHAAGTGTAAAVSGGTTLAQASEWIVAAVQGSSGTGGVSSWGAGFTQRQAEHDGGSYPFCTTADQVVASTSAVNGSATLTASGNWTMCQVALKAAAGGGGGGTGGTLGTPYTAATASEVITSGSTWQIPLSHDVAAHDALVLSGLDAQTAITEVTDSKNHQWTLIQSIGIAPLLTRQFAVVDCQAMASGSDWIRITFGTVTATAEIAVIVRGCSGVAATGAIDTGTTRKASGTSASPAVTGTAGLSAVPAWVVAAVGSGSATGGPSGAWGGGFTEQREEHQTGQPYLTLADQVVTTPGGGGGRAARLIGFDVMNYTDPSGHAWTWNEANAQIGPGQTHRIFYTGALPSTFSAFGAPDNVVCMVSYKTENTNVAAYVNSIPDGRETWMIFHHEPEDEGNAAGFNAAFRRQSNLIRAQNKPYVKVVMCAMAYQYHPGASNYTAAIAGDFVRGLGDYCDIFTCDVYQGSGGTAAWDWSSNGLQNLDHWTNWLRVVTDPAVVGTERPLGITEYGLDHDYGVFDDAAWNAVLNQRMKDDRDYLISAFEGANPVSPWPLQCWCYWWQDRGTSDPNNCQFTDPDMTATWQAIENTAGSSAVNASVSLGSSGPWAMAQVALLAGPSGGGQGGSPPSVSTADLPAAEAGRAYSQTLAAEGGTTPYTWSVTAGALPDGLALSAAGAISGTPLNAGTSAFTVVVTDASAQTGSASFALTVAASLAVSTTVLPGGQVTVPYAAQLAATGGTGALAWAVASGSLPSGLTLSPGGLIAGTPSGTGTSNFTVSVTDAYGTVTAALSITVTAAVLTVTTGSLPAGITGVTYSAQLAASAGTPPYGWTITAGALPPGLGLTSGGLITGTPTTGGTYIATFTATDQVAATASAVLPIAVSRVTESLIIAGQIELLGDMPASTIPECAGAQFILGEDFDLSSPQNTSASTAAVYLDGERQVGRRASNRTISLPVIIRVPNTGNSIADRTALAAAREVLLGAIEHETWELTWTRPGGLPMVYDCLRANATQVDYDLLIEAQRIATMVISFSALPYGRSDTPVVADFPATLPGRPAPPTPVVIDNFATVTGTSWSQSLIGPGPHSAFWHTGTNGVGRTATYQRTGIGPLNLAGQKAVTLWLGLGSSEYFAWMGLRQRAFATVKITLSDGTAAISMHITRRVRMTNSSYAPYWQKVRVAIPQGAALNYSAITGYTVTVSTRASDYCPYTDVYLSTVAAVPFATANTPAPSGGAVYDLAGIVGTARSLAGLRVQQGKGTLQLVVRRFAIGGAGQFLCPPDVTVIKKVRCYGSTGRGGTSGTVAFTGGSGGCEYAEETDVPVSPGTVYPYYVAKGGTTSSGTPDPTTITFGAVTVTAHSSANVGDSATGTPGATGSANSVHYPGGAGGNGAGGPHGGGGGGAAGPAGAGLPGAAGSGTGNGGGPGPGGTDGGRGGNGAFITILRSAAQPGQPAGGGAGGGIAGSPGGGGYGADGEIILEYYQTAPMKTLVVHRPRSDAPDSLCPFVPLDSTITPDGGTEVRVPSLIDGTNARFDSTYSIIAVSAGWHNPSAARTVTVTIRQYEQAGGTCYTAPPVTRTVTPADLVSPLCRLGDITLPGMLMPDDNVAAYFTAAIRSSDQADRFKDILLLDTAGSTIAVESPVGYTSYWIDEPVGGRDIGNVLGSNFDRGNAVNVMGFEGQPGYGADISGPPLSLDPIASNQSLLLYSAEGPPAAQITYFSRWMLDRVS